jgi:hypothetical protein
LYLAKSSLFSNEISSGTLNSCALSMQVTAKKKKMLVRNLSSFIAFWKIQC